jgi:predicted transcriptional regulator
MERLNVFAFCDAVRNLRCILIPFPLDKHPKWGIIFPMMGIYPTIRDIVREACMQKGLSLNKLALRLGVSPAYMSNILNGRKTSRPLIRRLSNVLDLPDLPKLYEGYLKAKKSQRSKSHKGGVRHGKKVERKRRR